MTRPQTWDWTESLSADTPSSEQQTSGWVAQDVFRTAEETAESGPELSLAEFAASMGDGVFGAEVSEQDESGEVELAEWEQAQWEQAGNPVQDEAFPSGLTLPPGTGATAENAEHWDPNDAGLPLYATGPTIRSQKLSPNFTVGELVSSGGKAADVARISPALVRCLQTIRDRVGKPVLISSGYRSWARNVALYRARGATPTRSRHCSGQAADINVAGMSGLDLAKAALDSCGPDIAVGIGTTYAHIDVRGSWAHWSYASGDTAKRDLAAIDTHRRQLATTHPTPAGTSYIPGGVLSGTTASGYPVSDYLGGKLWTFTTTTLPLRVAVFCPRRALARGDVEVLLFTHGLPDGCRRPKQLPAGFITDLPFDLGRIVDASGRPMVLVVPLLDWVNPGGGAAFGRGRERWHALAKPQHLNGVIREVLAELGRLQARTAPSIRDLIIAGHSRAYDFLEPLAHQHLDPARQQGALGTLSQVWALDTSYDGRVDRWVDWLTQNPRLQVHVFYEPHTGTAKVGGDFYRHRSARLAVTHAYEGHCAVPAKRLPTLLSSPNATPT